MKKDHIADRFLSILENFVGYCKFFRFLVDFRYDFIESKVTSSKKCCHQRLPVVMVYHCPQFLGFTICRSLEISKEIRYDDL